MKKFGVILIAITALISLAWFLFTLFDNRRKSELEDAAMFELIRMIGTELKPKDQEKDIEEGDIEEEEE